MSNRNIATVLFCTAAIFTLCATGAKAAVIASYEFTDLSAASSDADPNSSAGAFDVTPVGGGFSGLGDDVFVQTSLTSGFSTTGAVANNDYVGFTVDLGSSTYDLTSLSFDYHIQNTFNGGGFGVRVMNNVTGFTDFSTVMDSDNAVADVETRTYGFGTTTEGDDTATVNVNLDLTDPYASNIIGDDLQGVTGPVEFRFYLIDTSGALQRFHRIDNVVLQGGLAPVPEPSTLALGIIGLLGLLGCVRRRRR